MQIFGIELWRIILAAVLIFLVVKRANIVAFFAKRQFSKGNIEKAVKIFNIASKVGNLNVANRIVYGYLLLRSGQVDDALVELRGALPMTKPDSADRYQIKNFTAIAYWKQGNLKYAIEELEEVTETGFKNTRIYENLGILYNLGDDKEKALSFNEEAYEYNSDDNIIADNYADALAICGQLEKSAEIYKDLVSREPEPRFPEAYYGYGRVLIELGEREKGMQMIEKSLTKTFSFLSIKPREEIEKMLEDIKKDA